MGGATGEIGGDKRPSANGDKRPAVDNTQNWRL